MNNNYYVYIYLDPRKPGIYKYHKYLTFDYEPFYVGKGINNRMYAHKYKSKEKRKHHMFNKINKIIRETNEEPIIIIYKNKLSNERAYYIEKILINKIGRLNNNTGPLINQAEGGHGANGYVHSKETLDKMSKSMLNHYKNNINLNIGKKRSLKSRKNISQGRIGIVYGRESYLKASLTKNIKPILQYDLHGNFIKEWELLSDIKKQTNIKIKNINSCINGKRNVVEGYIWKRKNNPEYPTKIQINFKITKKHGHIKSNSF